MDSLFKLVDERINKYLSNSPFIVAVPCVVLDVLSDNMLKVQLTASKTVMTVPNWSGSDVEVGENVQLFYRGAILSEQTAYVGASENKGGAGTFVTGESYVGTLPNDDFCVAMIAFKNANESILLAFNAVIQDGTNSTVNCTFKVYVDEQLQSYSPVISTITGGYNHISFVMPLYLAKDSHTIRIFANGEGAIITAVESSVWGIVETTEHPYEPTSENDYIYYTTDDMSGTVYYIGESLYPIVPDTFNTKPLEAIGCTTFNYSDVKAASIPDGVERIE